MLDEVIAPTRPYRTEWLWVGLGLALLGLVLGYSLLDKVRNIEAVESDRLRVQARVVDDILGLQIQAIDHALLDLREVLARPDSAPSAPAASRLMRQLGRVMPDVLSMVQVDADGRVLASTRADLIGTSQADRTYFRHAKDRFDPNTLHVGEPYTNEQGVLTLALVRALAGPAGEFAGIVAATLDPGHLGLTLDPLLHAPDMRVVLIHGHGKLFLNMPANQATLGSNARHAGSLYSRHLASGGQASLLRGSTVAGADRLAAMRTLRRDDVPMDTPLVIGVGRDPAAIFAQWRMEVVVAAGLYVLLALVAVSGVHLAQRRRRRSERLAAAQATELAESEARFRSLSRLSSDWFWEQDAQFRFIRVDGELKDGTSLSLQNVLGKTRWELPVLNLTEVDMARHRGAVQAHQEFRDFVMLRPQPQGLARWVSINGEPIFDAKGVFHGYRGTGRDITEVMEDKERLQLVLRGSHDAPWDLDLTTWKLWFPQRWNALLGYPEGSLGLTAELWQQLCHPEDLARVNEGVFAKVKSSDDDFEIELRLRRIDGSYLPMLMRGHITRNSKGRAIRISGVNTDLTERKRAEADRDDLVRALAQQQLHQLELTAAEQARSVAERHAQELSELLAARERTIQERDQLLGLLAHEVRQPLNNASAALQGATLVMADRSEPSGAALSRLERAQRVLDQVGGTVNNALAASTLLSNAARITVQEVDIDAALALAMADIGVYDRSRVHAKRITSGRTAELNLALVRLALRNLLTNALSYSPQGSEVRLSVEHCDDPLALVIEVADQGEGIAPELLPTLFERGTRGPSAALVPGAGLGLYVVARVVALHRGKVEARANQPHGTVFRIELPQGSLD